MDSYPNHSAFTQAGDPIIHFGARSDIFGSKTGDALDALNQAIIHLNHVLGHCLSGREDEIERNYGFDLGNTICLLMDLRDGEFADCVNWSAIARAVRDEDVFRQARRKRDEESC